MRSTGSGESGSPGERLAALVERHRDVVAQLADLVGTGALTTIPVTALPPLVESLVRSLDRGTAVATAVLGQLDASGDLIEGRYASTTRWLQAVARTSDGEAAAMLGRARDLRGDYTRVGDAWLAGDIPSGAVRELTTGVRRALTAIPSQTRDATRDDVLDTLLPVAGIDTVTDLRRLVKTLRFVLDPDGATQAALDAYDDQSLRVAVSGPMAQISMWTTAETAAALLTVLDQQVNAWFQTGALPGEEPRERTRTSTDPGTATTTTPTATSGPALHRREHLLALAFGETITGLLEHAMVGTRHGVAPHLTVLLDTDRFLAGLGADLLIPGTDNPVPLPNATIARIRCDADITTAITTTTTATRPSPIEAITALRDTARTVLYLGRTQRTVTPRLRRALEVRDRHCAFPDCRVDITRTHAHHITEWERGGSTDLDNLVLLCSRHHHAVHEGGWTISPAPGGRPHTTGCWSFTPPLRRQP
jgi:hypothetical protein